MFSHSFDSGLWPFIQQAMIQSINKYHISVGWMIKFAVHPISTLACSNVIDTIRFIRTFWKASWNHICPQCVRLDHWVLPHCCFYKMEQKQLLFKLLHLILIFLSTKESSMNYGTKSPLTSSEMPMWWWWWWWGVLDK